MEFIELKADKSPARGKFHKRYSSFENLENAGLMLNDKIVLVDFDNDNVNENKIIDYFNEHYPTLTIKTTKGIHFYYLKPENIDIGCGVDVITNGGFQIDYKNGDEVYGVVKLNGITRETNKPLSFENLPELPNLFYPLKKQKDNLSGMCEGDGRNDSLFKHLCHIRRNYPNLEINDIAKMINDIVFAEPLDDNELESVINSVYKYYDPEEYYGEQTDIIAFAQRIISKLDIKLYNTQLYFKDENCYVSDDRLLLRRVSQIAPLKKAQDQELIHQLYKISDEIEMLPIGLPILLKNGAIIDGEYSSNTEPKFTPFYLDVEYNSSAYDKYVDKFLNDVSCNRLEIRQTLEEILGHILLTSKFPAHVFFLSGGGNNGKSTFLEMINNFVGKNGQYLSLDAFNDDTSVSSLNNKLCNCSDETDDIQIDKCKRFKSLASGNTITVRPIYSQPVKVKSVATLILSANKMPVFKDRTQGFFRRLMIIPFDFVVTDKISNLDILLSSDNAKSYILNLALNGIKRIKSNNYKMTENNYIKAKIEEYITENDSVASFMEEYNSTIEDNLTKNVYHDYYNYCCNIGFKALSLSAFSSRLKDFGYQSKPTTILHQTCRVYRRIN